SKITETRSGNWARLGPADHALRKSTPSSFLTWAMRFIQVRWSDGVRGTVRETDGLSGWYTLECLPPGTTSNPAALATLVNSSSELMAGVPGPPLGLPPLHDPASRLRS